jgi:hypothetical protein
MNKLIYSDSDGNVSIVIPANKSYVELLLGSLTDEEFKQHVINVSVPPEALNIRELNDNEIPQDRYFRKAWTDTGVLTIDLSKSRIIHMNNLRVIRNKLLSDLDVPMMKAQESANNDLINTIKQQKQALRDMPQNTDLSLITDLEQLKQFLPDILK